MAIIILQIYRQLTTMAGVYSKNYTRETTNYNEDKGLTVFNYGLITSMVCILLLRKHFLFAQQSECSNIHKAK